ncbi:oxidoreductase [Actinokineospora sp.]|uniref:oxidoreductase n=1 Tax=Actinokineospora sp. TaxID=1872133 RepID=UPI004037D0E3
MTGWTEQDVPAVEGKVAIVTGANVGLGFETTRVLAKRGATVVMACRNQQKANAARDLVLSHGVAPERVRVSALDLADQGSIEAFADEIKAEYDSLDLLINNAGLMGLAESKTADGFDTQFGVNHLGHMALTLRLLPVLNETAGARVVTVTSFGHRPGRIRLDDPNFEQGRHGRWRAYFQSKLANILFTAELGRRLDAAGAGTLSTAAHPGYSRTELGKDDPGLRATLFSFSDRIVAQSAAAGAVPTLRAATDPDAVQGALYGPRMMAFGTAVPETPSRTARDAELAAKLWDLSMDLLAPAKVSW